MSYNQVIRSLQSSISDIQTLQFNSNIETRSMTRMKVQLEEYQEKIDKLENEVSELRPLCLKVRDLRNQNISLRRAINSATRSSQM
jgi:hypothetical protein